VEYFGEEKGMKGYAKCIAMLIAAMIISFTGIAPASAATVQLSGRVTDQAAIPIAGATVAVIDPTTSGTVASATTDPTGNYTVPIGTGTYNITVTPPVGSSFQPATLSNEAITGDLVLNFDLVLAVPTVMLSGRITDAAGNGIPDQSVFASTAVAGFPGPIPPPTFSGATDATGHYAIQLPSGTYNVQATGNNSAAPPSGAPQFNIPPHWSIVLTAPVVISQDITLDFPLPSKQVNFHVQDPTGAPVTGATINTPTFAPPTTPTTITIGGLTATASSTICCAFGPPPVTNDGGNATTYLFAGTYTFVASPPSGSTFSSATVSNVVVSDTTPTVPFTLVSTVLLSGRITDAAGNGIPDQSVFASTAVAGFPGPIPPPTFSGATDATGHYAIQLPSGTYNVQATGNNSAAPPSGAPQFNIPPHWSIVLTAPVVISQDITLDFPLPSKQVNFHVQDPTGAPVTGATINTPTFAPPTTPTTITIGGLTATASSTICCAFGPPPVTNDGGNATTYLFAGTYTFVASPPSGSPLAGFTLTNAVITTDQTLVIALQYVHAAPVTTATVSPALTNGTTTDPATVTLSATAASGFTVASTSYTVDGGAKQTYAAPFAITGTGPHTVVYSSVDNLGVAETSKTLSFTIVSDTVPPTTTASLGGTAGNAPWYRSAVTVTLSATDNTGGSGVAATSYILDNGAQQTYSAPFTVSADGVHTVTFWSVDKANNAEPHKQQSISIDATPPTGVTATPERAPDSNGWYNHAVKVTYSGADATSGLASCTSTTYSGPDSGTASVTGTCADTAGNVSAAVPYTFKYDGTKPTLNSSVSPNPVLLNGAATATPNAADASSGVASQSCAAVVTSAVGAKTVACTATDTAGNANSATVSYNVTYKVCLLYDPTKAVKSGGVIALKVQLCDASGANVSASGIVVHATGLQQVDSAASPVDLTPSNANPDSDFRYDSTLPGYIYNLKTTGLATGTWQMNFTVAGDPVAHSIQFDVR
jgi:hypothetical protein